MLDELNHISCLKSDMIDKFHPITVNQLRDCTMKVLEKNIIVCNIGNVFLQLKFTSDCIKKWFAKKYKRRFLELDTFSKMHCEKENFD